MEISSKPNLEIEFADITFWVGVSNRHKAEAFDLKVLGFQLETFKQFL